MFVALLAALTWRFARAGLDADALDTFLHLPDLVFHEAGHIILSPFGRFVTVLGGSLFQIVVPLVCMAAFLRQQGNQFAAAVCLWWAGQNFVDVAPYIADARRLQLPLIGGQTGTEVEGHDWEYLLWTLGWAHLDVPLGRAAMYVGLAIMVAALAWALRATFSAKTAR